MKLLAIIALTGQQEYIYGASLLFILMISLIAYLFFNINLRIKAEKELKANNMEISALYHQLSAADQELKNKYDELLAAQKQLENSELRYRLVVESTNDAIWEWDLLTNKRFFSSKWLNMLGYCEGELEYFHNYYDLIPSEDYEKINKALNQHLEGLTDAFSCEYRVRNKNGDYLWIMSNGKALFNEQGKAYRMIGAYTDITELKENQNKISKIAYYDSLTSFPNRSFLKEHFVSCIRDKNDEDMMHALLYVDVDNFKNINDTFGHTVGDQLLVEIASRIKEISDDNKFIFRIGGDEFAIVLSDICDQEDVIIYLEKLAACFEKPILIEDRGLYVSLSIGIALYPDDGDDLEELLKNADTAMYSVKDNGKKSYAFYDKSMNKDLLHRMNIESNLRNAIINNELQLYYQPQYCINTGKITAFEALLRWFSPVLGYVPPDSFIKIAEDTGLIIDIGDWVLRRACEFAVMLNSSREQKLRIAVNISVVQLLNKDFVQKVITVLKETGLDPQCLDIEITETMLMDSFEQSGKKLEELRMLGVSISLDDFGTGYSSLNYLRQLPFNILKIDKTFIDDVLTNPGNNRITGYIIALAHSLNIQVVAEGVEHEEQYKYLKDNACDLIQGYLLSKPIPEDTVFNLLGEVV